MMPSKTFAFFSLWALIVGCNDKVQAKFVVINNTGAVIDSFHIWPNRDSVYKNIDIRRQTEYRANMTGLAKVDGAYHLHFKQQSKMVYYVFGYYTNGVPLEDYTTITIEPDTILVKQHWDD